MFRILRSGLALIQSIIMFCPRKCLSMQSQHSPLYPLLSLLYVSSYSPFIILLSIIRYLLLPRTSISSTIPSGASSRPVLISQWPNQFFPSSLSAPAVYFLLPLSLAQLHFLFCYPFYTLHSSLYQHIKCFQSFLLIPS